MALQCTITKKGITSPNAYHTVAIINHNQQREILKCCINTWPDQAYRASNPGDHFAPVIWVLTPADFQTYATINALNPLNQNIFKRLYEFLKTIDPDTYEDEHPYKQIPCDFLNDSTDILEE